MSGYTKGPWEARKGAGWFVSRPAAIARRDAAVAVGMTPATTLVCSPDWFDEEEAKANAFLMAASPELLEALKAIVGTQGSSYSIREREKALAAIAKAEGL